MRRLAIACLALALVVLCLWLVRPGVAPRAGPGPAAAGGGGEEAIHPSPAEVATGGGREELGAGPAETAGGAVAAARPAPGELRGLVLDAAGRPVAGAWVVSTWELQAARSDAAGRFRLALEAPAGPGSRRTLWAWAEGLTLVRRQLTLGLDEEEVRIALASARPLELTVEAEESAAPLPGARVEWLVAGDPRAAPGGLVTGRWLSLPVAVAATDAAGHALLPDGGGGLVRVQAPGRPPVLAPVGRWNHRILVPGRWERFLRLYRPDGSPLAGVQVAFPGAPAAVRTDARGLAPVPPETSGLLAWTEVALGDRRFWVLADPGTVALRQDRTAEVVVDHRPRRGRVLLPPGLPADAVEVATTAVAALPGMGTRWHPDPERTPERLAWQSLAAGGAFRLAEGWQGPGTALVLRRRADGRLLHRATLEGGGPYEVAVPARYQARLRFRARPQEVLSGARAVLVRTGVGWEEETLPPLPLDAAGAVATELTPGSYRVQLRLRGEAGYRQAGVLEMPAGSVDRVFDLGELRLLRGRVLAAGAPVFPGRVRLRRPGSSWTAVAELDETGAFAFRAVPVAPLEARVEPGDPWLEPPTGLVFPVPAAGVTLTLVLPAGTLRLALDPGDPPALDDLWVERQPLPGEASSWARRPALPAGLLRGPVELRVTPARYRFGTTRDLHLLRWDEVQLADGGTATLTLALVAAGRVEVRVDGLPGPCIPARMEFRSLDPAGETARARRGPTVLQGRAGTVIPPWDLAPGRWRLHLAGPFRGAYGGPDPALPAGPWELDFAIGAGEELEIRLQRDEDGNWVLVPAGQGPDGRGGRGG